MAHPTSPAFVYDFPNGDFDEITRTHPALKWLENYLRGHLENDDSQETAHSTGHRHDSFIRWGGGKEVRGRDDHFQAAQDIFAPYSDFYHVYDHIVVWETEDGWMSLGTANFYFNNVGGNQERKHKSHDGRTWEGVTPGAYKIYYAKGGNDEVHLAGVHIFSESFAG